MMELTEALKKYGYAGVVTLLLAGSLLVDIPEYKCEGNEPEVRECIKLSKSERSCYHMTGRDLCSGGFWTAVLPAPVYDKSNIERCTPQGCEPILKTKVLGCCYPSNCPQARDNPENCDCTYAVMCGTLEELGLENS